MQSMAGIFFFWAQCPMSAAHAAPDYFMPYLALASFWQPSLAAPVSASQRSLAALYSASRFSALASLRVSATFFALVLAGIGRGLDDLGVFLGFHLDGLGVLDADVLGIALLVVAPFLGGVVGGVAFGEGDFLGVARLGLYWASSSALAIFSTPLASETQMSLALSFRVPHLSRPAL
jgi:hypothetical protein